MRTSGSIVQTRDIRFGRVAGEVMLARSCPLLEGLDGALATLKAVSGATSDDAALEFVVALSEGERVEVAARLEAAGASLPSALNTVQQLQAFFSLTNLDRITRWDSHHDAPVPMRASLRDFGDRGRQKLFEIAGGNGRRCAVVIEATLWGADPQAVEAA